jgi:hypothetical protein
MVRDYNTLYNLSAVLDHANTRQKDIVVLHLRLLTRAASGEHDLEAEQLVSFKEQELFTRALAIAEKKGKTVRLAVAAATEKWDGILRAAQSLRSSAIALGRSPSRSVAEEARLAGLAWERLPDPKPQLTLEIYIPSGQYSVFYLGPHAPHLTPKEIERLHAAWLALSTRVAPLELHHHDVVHFALDELLGRMENGAQNEMINRLRRHLEQVDRTRSKS